MIKDMITLSTGKQIYANCGLISIGLDYQGNWRMCEGYDGNIDFIHFRDNQDDGSPEFTKDELLELIELVKNTWNLFKFAVINGEIKTK